MLPVVLAGPIIRRVDRQHFWIWFATSVEVPLQVKATVYAPAVRPKGAFTDTKQSTTSKQNLVKAGKNIFVSLLKVSLLSGEFPVGGYVEYEIVGGVGDIAQAVKERCRRVSLASDHKLKFFVPFVGSDKAIDLLYVSCRRICRSRNDAVLGIASECRRRLNAKISLPTTFILGGDQIYADDVDTKVLEKIKETRAALFDSKSVQGSRRNFVSHAQFTTGRTENHLVDFEELTCLYLLSWSTELGDRGSRDILTGVSEWEGVMAHIPTYMIFDDHEVTDDWFIDTRWKEDVLTTLMGRRFVDDALAAYFIFQGWGNDPVRFAEDDIESLGGWLARRDTRPRLPVPLVNSAIWTYVIPGDWLILCLDCRTKRLRSNEWSWFEFHDDDGSKPYQCPVLEPLIVAPSELVTASEIIRAEGNKRGKFSIVVVNTPIFALPVVGRIQEIWRRLSRLTSRSYATNLALDPESWDIDPASWVELVRTLLSSVNTEKWVMLSGDVHFSFVAKGEFKTPAGKVLSCLQITASPVNNETEDLRYLPYLHHLTFSSSPEAHVSQAIWLPQSGVSKGTPPMTSEEEFSKLLKKISQNRGQDPYIKKWAGIVLGTGRNAISTSNAYANLRLSNLSLDVSILNTKGEPEREFSWK